jgi:hypothetical protein
MVIPSRWMAGGRGMDEFRKEMLSSHNLLKLVDYPVSKEVFPNVEVKGGICYFLWPIHMMMIFVMSPSFVEIINQHHCENLMNSMCLCAIQKQ